MRRIRSLLLLCCFMLTGCYHVFAQSGGSCVTPTGERAKCVSIFSCDILYKTVRTTDPDVKKFLRASQCGYNNTYPLVCCGTTASYPNTTVKSLNLNHQNANLLPNRSTCGYQVYQVKIWNGQMTSIGEFPWMALLWYRNSSGFEQYYCAGTLINNRYVVTAAHCVVGKIWKSIGTLKSVRLGEWNVDKDPDCFEPLRYRDCSDKPINVDVESAIVHPDYDDNSNDRYHDIALLRLNQVVKFSDYISPVCLPTSGEERANDGELLQLVGWGKTDSRKYSPTIQKLRIPVLALSQCQSMFRKFNVSVADTQMCAGGISDEDSCVGDSGGPLLNTARNDGSQFYIEGIVSIRPTCGSVEYPGIYTRVSEYLTWILDNLKP